MRSFAGTFNGQLNMTKTKVFKLKLWRKNYESQE